MSEIIFFFIGFSALLLLVPAINESIFRLIDGINKIVFRWSK